MITTQQFIEKSIAKHGNRYDYSKSICTKSKVKVIIGCKIHGDFEQLPDNHIKGQGCKSCYELLRGSYRRKTTHDFIERSRIIHNDKYDYARVDYNTNRENIIIICTIHGAFPQRPEHHLAGHGCDKCAKEKNGKLSRITQSQFILQAIEIHNKKYDYSLVDYVKFDRKVTIKCPYHGRFDQRPADHLDGHGCPFCSHISNVSTGEKELSDYLESMISIETSNRKVIAPYEIDCFIPSMMIGIEYCGVYYHSDKFKENNYHSKKLKKANESGINLVQIFDDEWIEKQDIVKSIIANKIGVSNHVVYARKTTIKHVSNTEAKKFLNDNHIQGYVNAQIQIGLYHKEEPVMLATFSQNRSSISSLDKGWYELVRLCSKQHTSIVGGFSKVLKYFKEHYNPIGIKTYCDKRFFDGKGYECVGFIKSHDTVPSYYYVKSGQRYSRYLFQKHKLHKVLKIFDVNLSEHENMKANGYSRIYDCGLIVYKLEFK